MNVIVVALLSPCGENFPVMDDHHGVNIYKGKSSSQASRQDGNKEEEPTLID